jgi:hypothetical protein
MREVIDPCFKIRNPEIHLKRVTKSQKKSQLKSVGVKEIGTAHFQNPGQQCLSCSVILWIALRN